MSGTMTKCGLDLVGSKVGFYDDPIDAVRRAFVGGEEVAWVSELTICDEADEIRSGRAGFLSATAKQVCEVGPFEPGKIRGDRGALPIRLLVELARQGL